MNEWDRRQGCDPVLNMFPNAVKNNKLKYNCFITHIIDEVADIFWVGRAWHVLMGWHINWNHVVPEHIRFVVQTTVKNTQVIILEKHKQRLR